MTELKQARKQKMFLLCFRMSQECQKWKRGPCICISGDTVSVEKCRCSASS